MNKCLSRHVIRLSTIVTICTQGVLSSQSIPPADSGIKATTGHIWSVSGDAPASSRAQIQRNTQKSNLFPTQHETVDSDWEKGWNIEPFEESDDLHSFFTLPDEEPNTKPTPEKSSKKPTSSTELHKNPGILFSFDERENNSSASLLEKASRQAKFTDFGEDEWDEDPVPIATQADISTAQKQRPNVIHPEKTAAAKPEENCTDTCTINEEAPTSQSLGSKRVAVPSYISPNKESTSKATDKQSLSSSKAPYIKMPSKQVIQGVFGPAPSQPVAEAKKDPAPTTEKTRKEKPQIAYSINDEGVIAQMSDNKSPLPPTTGQLKTPPKTILINFNNVGIIEYLRFISRITNKNFVFDEGDLQFNVTIISEEPTTIENVMTALIQELRVHNLSLIEQDNNMLIHRNPEVKGISKINVDGIPADSLKDSQIVTQVFRLNTLDPSRANAILRPLLSKQAQIGIAAETRHLIITDIVSNLQQVAILIKSIDSPNSGLVIGQYVVRNAFMDTLIQLAQKIMDPIARDQSLVFVPHPAAKSIFIVSSPFIVERTISVLQHLDNFEGTTRIYDLDELKFQDMLAPGSRPIKPETPTETKETPTTTPTEFIGPSTGGSWEIGPQGNKIFRPGFKEGTDPNALPQGSWILDPNGNWFFVREGTQPPFRRATPFSGQLGVPTTPPGTLPLGRITPFSGQLGAPQVGTELPEGLVRPSGSWVLDADGNWIFQLTPGEEIQPEALKRTAKPGEELPLGHLERTKFFIYKLQFRKGAGIVEALALIGQSLQLRGDVNQDLAATIATIQWLEASNSIVFTGTDSSIEKVKELIDEIDRPVRQVFIEMLILETTIDDSLEYGVTWGTRSGGGSTATAQAFLGGASPVPGALTSGAITEGDIGTPDASTFISAAGYHLGIIGRRLTHNGTQFATLSALVTALHTRSNSNILLNPKIITEDNKPAEIFVGINTSFQTQSIANDQGSLVTSNFEFRDVGTRLKVTPLIGASGIITMEIEQEVSRSLGEGQAAGSGTASTVPGPTTSINRTQTTIHVPDNHFVIISGMIQDEQIKARNQFPCLGGIPILGAAFSDQTKSDAKRNLMIFIRPQIIDTAEQYRTITKRQQEVLKQKNHVKKSWKYEVDEALDFMNLKPPCCDECE